MVNILTRFIEYTLRQAVQLQLFLCLSQMCRLPADGCVAAVQWIPALFN